MRTKTRNGPAPLRLLGAAGVVTLLAVALAGPLDAQTRPIEERRQIRADATVNVSAVIHSIRVERWDRNEVEVRGEYDEEWEYVETSGDDRTFRFELRHHEQR
jgi:hypothetical protein